MQGGGTRLDRIVDTIAGHDADTLVLTEVTPTRSAALAARLKTLGYRAVVPTAPPAGRGGVMIASRLAFTMRRQSRVQGAGAYRWAEVRFTKARFTLVGVYFPDTPKAIASFWPHALAAVDPLRDAAVLLVGDFNSGQSHFDAEGQAISSDRWFTAMPFHGFADLWRHTNGDAREYTWYSQGSGGTPRGYRIDHAFGTASLRRRVRKAWYSHDERLRRDSDHSSMLISVR